MVLSILRQMGEQHLELLFHHKTHTLNKTIKKYNNITFANKTAK